jgi:hypothetical protein
MDDAPVLVGYGTVIERRPHGPQLCLGAVLMSLPPQGGGPAVTNWDWSEVRGSESMSGTTWGEYTLVGTYDGRSFTMTQPPVPGDHRPRARRRERNPFATPGAPPPGGWRVVDASRATEDALQRTSDEARTLAGFARLWVDEPAARTTNDPGRLVLNVAVTGDTQVAEARLRELWGGALCVSTARYTEAELKRVEEELIRTPGALSLGTGRDRVELEVIHDDGTLQRQLDSAYGSGLVVVTSALQPFTG